MDIGSSCSIAVYNDTNFITGGEDLSSQLASTEIFDPNNLIWQTVGSLNIARFQHMNSNIDTNGNVFIAGGVDTTGVLQSCEIYDFILQTWSLVKNMTSLRNSNYY